MEAFYLAGRQRQRFCLYHPPQGGKFRGAVIAIHPFAEEMNRARRMLALQSRAFAAAGFGVLQLDLSGCGDSSGDFGEACWLAWVEDVIDASEWLRNKLEGPFWLWGTRAGCLVAGNVAPSIPDLNGMLLWQPVVAGRPYLRQFLRLRVASDMLDGNERISTEVLEIELAKGNAIEVAGYSLLPELAAGLADSLLARPVTLQHCVCLEVSAREEKRLTPALASWVEKERHAGGQIQAAVVDGPAFWQTAEISECPALLAASVGALIECSP